MNKPLPKGWQFWRGKVPPELSRFAIDAKNHIALYGYDQVAVSTVWQGTPVGAWKNHHSWTYRPEGLVTGLCIPGIALIVPIGAPIGTGAETPGAAAKPPVTNLNTPDPDLAVFPADPAGGMGVLWGFCSVVLAVLGIAGLGSKA